MLLNYLKLAIRLLARNPFFTFINVTGLSVGFAVFFILWQYSQSELKSDQMWKDWERIYRFGFLWEYTESGDTLTWHSTKVGFHDPSITKELAEAMGEIEDFTRIYHQTLFGPGLVTDHGKEIELSTADHLEKSAFVEENTAYADPNIFEFFNVPLLVGDPASVLHTREGVVISESVARKYFGAERPMDRTLIMNDTLLFKVTGVFKDLPRNTHLSFDILFSTLRLQKTFDGDVRVARTHNPYCYFKLRKGASAEQLQTKIWTNRHKFYGEMLNVLLQYNHFTPILQPLEEIAFNFCLYDVHRVKSMFFLFAMSGISMIVLIMAWINYILLSSACNRKRTTEFLARRTFGARSRDLVTQFLVESIVVNVLAVLLAFTFIQGTKSLLGLWFQFHVPAADDILVETQLIIGLFILTGIVICGMVPFISSTKMRLNGRRAMVHTATERVLGLQGLSVIQFVAAIVLIVCVFVVFQQVNFIISKDWGIEKEQVIVVDLPAYRDEHFEPALSALEKELEQLNIGGFTISQSVLGDNAIGEVSFKRTTNARRVVMQSNGGIDERFLPFFGIQLLQGRNFMPDHPADAQGVLISRKALERLGFSPTDSVVGQKILMEQGAFAVRFSPVWIIGVFDDYYIKPNVFLGSRNGVALTYKAHLQGAVKPNRISFRINAYGLQDAIKEIRKKYTSVFPTSAFNWYFLDDHVNRHFQSEKTVRNQILLLACLAIGIACLGLLGMLSNKVVEKTKEIGIRKVLGAELHQIAQVLVKTTIRQVVIATVIGIPIAFYLTQQYLEKFPERILLQWWHYTLPVLILVIIMFVTIASVLFKAVNSNPVEALKHE